MHTRADCSAISNKRCFKSMIQNEEIEVCSRLAVSRVPCVGTAW